MHRHYLHSESRYTEQDIITQTQALMNARILYIKQMSVLLRVLVVFAMTGVRLFMNHYAFFTERFTFVPLAVLALAVVLFNVATEYFTRQIRADLRQPTTAHSDRLDYAFDENAALRVALLPLKLVFALTPVDDAAVQRQLEFLMKTPALSDRVCFTSRVVPWNRVLLEAYEETSRLTLTHIIQFHLLAYSPAAASVSA